MQWGSVMILATWHVMRPFVMGCVFDNGAEADWIFGTTMIWTF